MVRAIATPEKTGAYSRMFAHHRGVIEDPATGSATGPLAAFMIRHRLASGADGTTVGTSALPDFSNWIGWARVGAERLRIANPQFLVQATPAQAGAFGHTGAKAIFQLLHRRYVGE